MQLKENSFFDVWTLNITVAEEIPTYAQFVYYCEWRMEYTYKQLTLLNSDHLLFGER